MKLNCDLCGGELQIDPNGQGATCTTCGLTYPMERLREIANADMAFRPAPPQPVPPRPVPAPAPVQRPARAKNADQKAQKKMKTMWIILALIGLFAFLSTLFTDSALPLVSIPALLITLFLFKPWEVYGGKP